MLLLVMDRKSKDCLVAIISKIVNDDQDKFCRFLVFSINKTLTVAHPCFVTFQSVVAILPYLTLPKIARAM